MWQGPQPRGSAWAGLCHVAPRRKGKRGEEAPEHTEPALPGNSPQVDVQAPDPQNDVLLTVGASRCVPSRPLSEAPLLQRRESAQQGTRHTEAWARGQSLGSHLQRQGPSGPRLAGWGLAAGWHCPCCWSAGPLRAGRPLDFLLQLPAGSRVARGLFMVPMAAAISVITWGPGRATVPSGPGEALSQGLSPRGASVSTA